MSLIKNGCGEVLGKSDCSIFESALSLLERCPYSEFFCFEFSLIRTEYGEIRSISPYSVRMSENTDQRRTLNTDAFHPVHLKNELMKCPSNLNFSVRIQCFISARFLSNQIKQLLARILIWIMIKVIPKIKVYQR